MITEFAYMHACMHDVQKAYCVMKAWNYYSIATMMTGVVVPCDN